MSPGMGVVSGTTGRVGRPRASAFPFCSPGREISSYSYANKVNAHHCILLEAIGGVARPGLSSPKSGL